jgi:peptidyl-prolyl cis-trans isomerase A (cyclophilin A)/peptidyl-prolyl cis-trans isomerase B (cyclophilin B)
MAVVAIIIIAVVAYAVISAYDNSVNTAKSEYSDTSTKVLLHTTAGDITIELRNDKPITTANFINIVKQGWYDNTTFFRVIASFMIQGGNISQNNQSVPPINDEIGNDNHNVAYTIAMAKTSQPNSATSQFFINQADNSNNPNNPTFDSTYTVFGKVISGTNVVDKIADGPVVDNGYGEDSQPVNPVTIITATIIS